MEFLAFIDLSWYDIPAWMRLFATYVQFPHDLSLSNFRQKGTSPKKLVASPYEAGVISRRAERPIEE